MTRPHGTLHWVFFAVLLLAGLSIVLSGRDLSLLETDLLMRGESKRHPLVAFLQRGVSLLLLLTAAERVISHLALHQRVPSPALAWSFVLFWLGTVLAPSIWGAHPQFYPDYTYSLAIGLAAVLAHEGDQKRVVGACRDGLFIFMLVGLLMIPVKPNMVLILDYGQGLFNNVPRFAGLVSHPVGMGMLALTALLCLMHLPYQRRWLNRSAWLLGLGVLFLAQSKTAWLAFLICFVIVKVVRHAASFWRRLSNPDNNTFGILTCVAFILLVLGVMLAIQLGYIQAQVADFFDSPEGERLKTLTGRNRIWAIALQEWQNSWWFGYGPDLWDVPFRVSIGMPNATHAHNQFIETLARSGTVGAITLTIYSVVMLVLSLKYAAATRGFSLALFTSLALLSVSETPLMLFGYSIDLFAHLLLIVTIASTAASRLPQRAQEHAPENADYRTAS